MKLLVCKKIIQVKRPHTHQTLF